jgi:hypothetical protein
MFGPNKKEVTGGWRKLHNEELRKFYSSPALISVITSQVIESGGACSKIVNEGK